MNSFAEPLSSRQNSEARCAQRFSNAWIEPSAARVTTIGVGPTLERMKSPAFGISASSAT